jgi:hypothetical protein
LGLLVFILLSSLFFSANASSNGKHPAISKRSLPQEPARVKDARPFDPFENFTSPLSFSAAKNSTGQPRPFPSTTTPSGPTSTDPNDMLLDPESIVIFNRSAFYNNQRFVNPEKKSKRCEKEFNRRVAF